MGQTPNLLYVDYGMDNLAEIEVSVVHWACSSILLGWGKLGFQIRLVRRRTRKPGERSAATMSGSTFYKTAKGKQIRTTMAERREIVARLLVRNKFTQVQIMNKLNSMGLVNVVTGKPFTKSTISTDCAFLHEESLARAAKTIDGHRAAVLDELDAVSREAWGSSGEDEEDLVPPNLPIVLATTKQRRAVIGVDSPVKIAPTDPTGQKEYGIDAREELISKLVHRTANNGTSTDPGESN